MFFQTDGVSKVICSMHTAFPAGTPNVIEQGAEGLTDPGVPSRLKVVNGVVVNKTQAELDADIRAAKIAAVCEIQPVFIIDWLKAKNKFDAALAAMNQAGNEFAKYRFDHATAVFPNEAFLLSMFAGLGLSVDDLAADYFDSLARR